MRNLIYKNSLKTRGLFILSIICFLSSCESFVDVDLTETLVTSDRVFSNEITATSAVTGIYNDMLNVQSFASGSDRSVTMLTGLSSDELVSYSADVNPIEFYTNKIMPQNANILVLWQTLYKSIYEANAIIEGLDKSTSITAVAKNQLMGEARFVRAFSYFYLVNLFGKVPLATTTDYRVNSRLKRSDASLVYEQILKDLEYAEENLIDDYPTDGRVRPNRFTALALHARVSIYIGEWSNAEILSSMIINDNKYVLENIEDVFKKDTREAIWQLSPVATNINTLEGYYFILSNSPDRSIGRSSLSDSFVNSFEPGDNRRTQWINMYQKNGNTWYYPFKYQVKSSADISEYSIVFRLAEQYLIRAEAHAMLGDFSDAIRDLDTLRSRSGLTSVKDSDDAKNQDGLLSLIERERKAEYFSEWGHRWFDLKRYGRATAVLGAIKNSWSEDDLLYPVPQSERNKNSNLGDQNPGY